MTDAEREAQRQSFARGQVAMMEPRLTVSQVGGMTSEDNWESIRQAYDAGIATKERQRVLDEVERNLRRILADERADQAHTVRDVLTVLIENALPKWREGP